MLQVKISSLFAVFALVSLLACQKKSTYRPRMTDAPQCEYTKNSTASNASRLISEAGDCLSLLPLSGPSDCSQKIKVNGMERLFWIHMPTGKTSNDSAPVIFNFHGGGGYPLQQIQFSKLNQKADSTGFVTVTPAGHGFTWNAGNCCGKAKEEKIDDIEFIKSILEVLPTFVNADEKKIYVTGHSNGAIFSYRLACELSNRFAAIAANSGGMGDLDQNESPQCLAYGCKPSRTIPILHIHGLEDRCYRYQGGKGEGTSEVIFNSIPDTMESWRVRNGCSQETEITLQSGKALCKKYLHCRSGGDVELCTIENAGHVWPGGETPAAGIMNTCGGETTTDLINNDKIWSFFSAH